jgi:glutamyl/glutaminyl-tRNA synthetase
MAQITEHVGYFRTRPALTPEARAHVASAEAQGVLRRVAEKLKEAGPLSGESFTALVRAVQAETQVKGKALYIPLRLALTGREHGPELHLIAPILGAVECRERIEAVLDPHRKPE